MNTGQLPGCQLSPAFSWSCFNPCLPQLLRPSCPHRCCHTNESNVFSVSGAEKIASLDTYRNRRIRRSREHCYLHLRATSVLGKQDCGDCEVTSSFMQTQPEE
jgi:hypothetical protein